MPAPRRFLLVRQVDVSGVSGTGVVAEGCVWSTGRAVLHWLTSTPSTGVYDSVAHLERIHGHGGSTRVQFVDPDPTVIPMASTGVLSHPQDQQPQRARSVGAHRA